MDRTTHAEFMLKGLRLLTVRDYEDLPYEAPYLGHLQLIHVLQSIDPEELDLEMDELALISTELVSAVTELNDFVTPPEGFIWTGWVESPLLWTTINVNRLRSDPNDLKHYFHFLIVSLNYFTD